MGCPELTIEHYFRIGTGNWQFVHTDESACSFSQDCHNPGNAELRLGSRTIYTAVGSRESVTLPNGITTNYLLQHQKTGFQYQSGISDGITANLSKQVYIDN